MKKILSALTALVLVLALLTGAASAQSYTSYDDIFADNWIIQFPQLFLMLDYYAYAIAMPDGVIDCMEYGVDGNMICEWVETIYIPTEGLNAEEKAALEYDMQQTFAAADAESFCEVTTNQLNNYLTIVLKFTDLEDKANIERLAALGFADPGVDYLGIDLTEQNLLAQGYLKDY